MDAPSNSDGIHERARDWPFVDPSDSTGPLGLLRRPSRRTVSIQVLPSCAPVFLRVFLRDFVASCCRRSAKSDRLVHRLDQIALVELGRLFRRAAGIGHAIELHDRPAAEADVAQRREARPENRHARARARRTGRSAPPARPTRPMRVRGRPHVLQVHAPRSSRDSRAAPRPDRRRPAGSARRRTAAARGVCRRRRAPRRLRAGFSPVLFMWW